MAHEWFIEHATSEFEAYRACVEKYTLERAERETGVPAEVIREAAHAYAQAGLDFARHAVAVTGVDSELDRYARDGKWIRRFPMWDWVGGRTSELAAVGLLPARLQGFDIDAMLGGARDADRATRVRDVNANPAALLALMWYHAGGGRGAKDMVILPYKDRLMLFCCQRCRVIQVQGSDGVAQFTARELHELGRMRLTFRMGERKA